MQERLQKIIAASGIASRRRAEELITAGVVTVNGNVVRELGTKADPLVDTITVHGKPLPTVVRVVYALNKPKGVISSRSDDQKRPAVVDFVPTDPPVYPVGRLDSESEGLILLTNDGGLANRLTHPRYGHEKEYELTGVTKVPVEVMADRLKEGAQLKDGPIVPDEVEFAGLRNGQPIYKITIHEGRNHLLRRFASKVGFEITRLRRIRIGSVSLKDLEPGKYRRLTQAEVDRLADR